MRDDNNAAGVRARALNPNGGTDVSQLDALALVTRLRAQVAVMDENLARIEGELQKPAEVEEEAPQRARCQSQTKLWESAVSSSIGRVQIITRCKLDAGHSCLHEGATAMWSDGDAA